MPEVIEDKKAKKYESVIPVGEIDRKFNDITTDEDGNTIYPIIADLRLIKSLDELREYVKGHEGIKVAVDTETTGLSYSHDYIVGFSLSFDAYSGIYVPIRHQHKKVFKSKENKVDENGEIMLTKAGKPRTHTVETYEFSDYEGNLDPKGALDILYETMMNSKFVLMHNSEFDMNMIKKEGYDVMKFKTFDTMLLPYIYDPEARLNGLKPLTKRLGRRVQDFSEVTGGEKEFQYTNPEESYVYAASDSTCTYFIYEQLYPKVRKLLSEAPNRLCFDGKPYDVLQEDNKLIRAFIDYYGHVELKVNKKVAQDYKELIDKETTETVEKIYSYFGIGPFSLSTGSKEFKGVMEKFHMNTGAKTKTGKGISYGKDGIKEMNKNINLLKNEIWAGFSKVTFVDSKIYMDKSIQGLHLANYLDTYGKPYCTVKKKVTVTEVRDLNNKKITKEQLKQLVKEMYNNEKKKLEILMLVLKYSSLMKALNSYVTKLTEVDSCRMRYRLTGTKSCRLSSGNGGKNSKDANDYYLNLNAQNLTKSSPQFYKAFQDNKEGNILGWYFEPVSDEYAREHKEDDYIVEGTRKTANIRSCFVANEGRIVASLDVASEEALALALISGDDLMISNFKKGIDPHKATAYAVWGPEAYNKFTRRKAKQANFLLSYGGKEYTLARNMDIPLEEARDIVEKYYKAYFKLASWKEQEIEKMYLNKGKIFTRFGRPRQLLPWLQIARQIGDDGIVMYSERSVCSHQIQGFCGDLMRRMLIKLYQRFFKNRDPNIDWLQSVHDENNFELTNDKKIIISYLRELQSIMDFPYLDPTLPIKTTIELGYSLGTCFPFVWTDDSKTELVPKREH